MSRGPAPWSRYATDLLKERAPKATVTIARIAIIAAPIAISGSPKLALNGARMAATAWYRG